jgi:hypothetical protein
MFWPRYDVFLSYSRADTERIQPLRDELRRLGYRVFFDVQSIDPGEKWKDRLDRSIRSSRTLILCWSENARASDYITFEYSRAEALKKRVFPWSLDGTPLPKMLELQAINEPDGAKAAGLLRPYLGWTLKRRRTAQALAAVAMAIVLAIGLWHILQPPPPLPLWSFQGEVTDLKTHLPIPGVEVDLKLADGKTYTDLTDSRGAYTLQNLPQPRPAHIHLQFRKQGYIGDSPIVESTQNGFDPLLEPLPEKQP